MAKDENTANETSVQESDESQVKETARMPQQKVSLLSWLILAAVIVAGSTGGFALSQLISGPIPPMAEADVNGEATKNPMDEILATNQEGNSNWLFEELEPVLANLDEPGVSRFIRVLVTLEVSPDLDPEKGKLFLADKQVILRDWLTTYFAGLSLEDVRGSRNHSRIKEEIQEQFNQILFPNSRPFVTRVLFKEFAVQ